MGVILTCPARKKPDRKRGQTLPRTLRKSGESTRASFRAGNPVYISVLDSAACRRWRCRQVAQVLRRAKCARLRMTGLITTAGLERSMKSLALFVFVLAAFGPITLLAQTTPDKDADSKNPAVAKTSKKDAKKDEKKEEPKEEKKGGMTADTFSGLKFRSIGPGAASGRVMSIAVNPKKTDEYYVGVASGGVWKTVNDGTTWTPMFDGEGSYSIGWVVLDPNDASVVWVGSGESNSQRSVGYGDGIYRSDDGGKSWQNLGLKKSEHIGRVVVAPRDSKVVYVAAEGPLWGPGGDRGLYKSADGGKTWKAVLTISENTGVVDIAMDPSNPEIIYA